MRGLDGNYMNTQADSLARLQVASMVEQNLQQARAQAEALNTLRKLREEVEETKEGGSSSHPKEVKDYLEGEAGGAFNRQEPGRGREKSSMGAAEVGTEEGTAARFPSHIDLRA